MGIPPKDLARIVIALVALGGAACGVVGPSCTDESGPLPGAAGQVAAGTTATHAVVSPRNSNILIRLTWPDTAATLGLRATITDCGEHTGCLMTSVTPPPGPGGPPPAPQPWPAGVREMLVDGTRGKAWRIEVVGDPERDAAFSLNVTYQIACER